MSNCNKRCDLSRRRFVRLAALVAASAGVAGEVPRALADDFKGTKQQAGYIEKSGPSSQTCGTCHSFIDPDQCQIVEGPVSPLGWCDWYSGIERGGEAAPGIARPSKP